MEKPTILKLKETENKIIEAINSSEVPAFIIRPMLEKILNNVIVIEQKELEQEKINYEKSLKEEKKEG